MEVDGREVTIWFGLEGDAVISAKGRVYGEKGYETMELLEDSMLYQISVRDLQKLYHDDIEVCNWASWLMEREFVRREHHLIANLSEPAAERYAHLSREKPEVSRRVQLQHIVSYPGITSEHLSRIRAGYKSQGWKS